jgi:uncharacterized protein
MIFIDSNIWCYYFDNSAKEHGMVAEYIESIVKKEKIVMNNLVVMELAHYLIKNLGVVKGKEKISDMLGFPFLVVDFDYELLLKSVDMLAEYTHTGIGGRDASILATMKNLNIKKIITHDKAFKKIDFVEVIDPVVMK